jgi:hypothetical protein
MTLRRLLTAGLLAASLLAPGAALAAAAAANPVPAAVEPAAYDALKRMSAYLNTLKSFEVRSTTVRDEVVSNGQKLQFGGTVTYKVRRPDGFVIETAEDRRVRQLIYDGKSLALYAPRMGFYARVDAPPTIRQTLDALESYDVHIPLEDLFVWGTDNDWRGALKAGYVVGYAHINGQDAVQYAFREEGVDWQIWIAEGDKPLPLRVVITSTDSPSQPQFSSDLTWNTAPQFDAAAFTFTPPADAKPIPIRTAH